ncbi:MAG: GMC family oxidoreductase [Myxococcaceae bacterium]|nr:GMC family oxidoreductase [Myxococcaceae bacterium]
MSWALSATERATLKALAGAAIPPGRLLPGAGESTLDRAEGQLAALPPGVTSTVKGLLHALEWASVPLAGSRFSRLPLGRRLDVLEKLEVAEATRLVVRGLLVLLKLSYTDDRKVYEALGCRFGVEAPKQRETARWREQLIDGSTLPDDEELECDVVIVGTGAGGAPLADELAARGLAVLLVEEGPYFGRQDLTGRPLDMMKKAYRKAGLTVAFGNTAIPIPVGRGVGGTTLINSGTCLRVAPDVARGWGIDGLSSDVLAPYYERVERFLEVGPSSKAALGRPAELIAKGCDALGYAHHPLPRNAPGCDGQGLCCFGCPTEAKRSTNVSYVPAALSRGAQLVTGLKIDRVRIDNGRAVGLEGVVQRPVREGRVRIRAKATVLACGSLSTPQLLLQQGLANRSDQVGRNLSIHPAAGLLGVFDEKVTAWNTVPQGYAIDEFKDEGLLFEGAHVPLELAAISVAGYGPRFTNLLEQMANALIFGFMVKDSSRGRVHANGGISYWLNGDDVAKVRRGLGILSRVFFAAGAREVHLPVAGLAPLKSADDAHAFERAPLKARHVDLTAYHPLGTCRMGDDPRSSVVAPSHRCHDLEGLYVCDGSVMPGSLGVNPQLTIMAFALRAAEHVARDVEAAYQRAA